MVACVSVGKWPPLERNREKGKSRRFDKRGKRPEGLGGREMDFGGGCCITRYAEGAYDMSKVDRIMLRFRPIAPKPVAGGSGSPSESVNRELFSKLSGRGKRKYSREKSNSSTGTGNKRRKRGRKEEKKAENVGGDSPVVTLPLLPETPELKVSPVEPSPPEKKTLPLWLSIGDGTSDCARQAVATGDQLGDSLTTRGAVMSCVTVESVSDTGGMEGMYGLGRTDDERKMNLERDSCPGFISDCIGRVMWTNTPYRKLVGNNIDGGETIVWLVMRERPMIISPAFTCRVRLQYTSHDGDRASLTLPCDVYRMDEGGFAWRLDVRAALCLGR